MRIALACTGNIGLKSLELMLTLPSDTFTVVAVFTHEIEFPQNEVHNKIIGLATDFNIKCYTSKELEQTVVNNNLDYLIAIKWRSMISSQVINHIKELIVFHASLLPKYRGFAPVNWPIINGEYQTGVTMFFAEEKVDSGDIIDQRIINITEDDDAYTIDNKINQLVPEMLKENLFKLQKGVINRVKQNHKDATYCVWRTQEDGLINWHDTSKNICNLIRGLTFPYPGAYTYWNRKKIIIWKAKIVHDLIYVGSIPGKIVNISTEEGVYVLTGDGVLCIKEVSIDNNDRVNPSSVITKLKSKFSND